MDISNLLAAYRRSEAQKNRADEANHQKKVCFTNISHVDERNLGRRGHLLPAGDGERTGIETQTSPEPSGLFLDPVKLMVIPTVYDW
jgi:hypothetical protein